MAVRGQRKISAAAACAVWAIVPAAARAQYQVPDPAFAAPATYYDPATATDGATLKAQLNDIIDGHTNSSYDAAINRLAVLDRDPNNASNLILIYSGFSVDATWDSGVTWNREHLWPDSLGIDGSGTDYGDLFNLRPSNPDVNSTRGNKWYDNVTGPLPNNPPTFVQDNAPEARMSTTAWNPPPNEHGDIARAMFYMDTRYDGADSGTTNLTLTDDTGSISTSASNMGVLSTLLAWHYQDGISNAERKRNDQIHDLYQNNRNPFVDRPELVWAVFGGGNNNSKLYVGASPPASGTSSANVNLRVIKGAAWGSSNVTLNKAGANPTTFDVTTSGAATSTSAGAGQTLDYDPLTRAIQVSLNGPTGATGTITGTVTIDNTDITSGGAGLGAQDGNDTINVTGTVLEHAQPSFVAGSSAAAQSLDFGYVPAGFAARTANFRVHNNPSAAGAALTASLDVDGATKLGSATMSTNVTASNPATPLAAGGNRIYIASFAPGATEGLSTATHTIASSDENIPGATPGENLVLTTTGRTTAGSFPVSGGLFVFGNETFNTTSFSLGDDAVVTKSGPGTMNIFGPQNHPTSTTATFIANAGAIHFHSDTNSTATTGLIVSANAAPLTFHSRQHLASLVTQANVTTVAPGGGNTLVLGSLVDAADAQLNLNDNSLIIRGSSGATVGTADAGGVYDGIQGRVQRGYNFAAWDGDGIVTQTEDAALHGITTLAVATPADVFFIAATDTMLWSGETVSGNDVLVMYTYAGDSNFDGLVDATDYGVIDNFVQFPGAAGYINGDFNYDGIIDASDYGIIDNTIQLQGPPIGTGGSVASLGAVAAVPEPAACAFAILAALPFLPRRRRRTSRPAS